MVEASLSCKYSISTLMFLVFYSLHGQHPHISAK